MPLTISNSQQQIIIYESEAASPSRVKIVYPVSGKWWGGDILQSLRLAVLPSSLIHCRLNALVYSTSPPVLVLGTVKIDSRDEGFLENWKSPN